MLKPGPSICQQQPQVPYSKAFASTDSRFDTADDVKSTSPKSVFLCVHPWFKSRPPRLDGKFTDVTRAQTPIRRGKTGAGKTGAIHLSITTTSPLLKSFCVD
jgi:hypothetical protein